MELIYKQIGETPLEALGRLREEKPELADESLSYAGRLDPMAEGLLLVLVGEKENQNRQQYLGLDKTYEFEVLFGAATDTFDPLGLVTNHVPTKQKCNQRTVTTFRKKLLSVLDSFLGEWEMMYPPYSSATVGGKQLWQWAREGRLDEIELPTSTVHISSLDLRELREVSTEALIEEMIADVKKVNGDFRQQEIVGRWHEVARKLPEKLLVAPCELECSAGTYVRRLAQAVGVSLDIPSLAKRIKRTRVGEYVLTDFKNL